MVVGLAHVAPVALGLKARSWPARLMLGAPAAGLHYVAGVGPVGVPAFAAAMALGAMLRTAPYAVLGQEIGSASLATILMAGASIEVGAVTAAVPGSTPPNPRCRHLSFASAPGNRRRRPHCCATAASRVSVDDPAEDEQPGELRYIAGAPA